MARKLASPTLSSSDSRGELDRGERPEESLLLRKAVNTLAIVPKSARITTLGRKSYNVLLYQAQEQGLEKDVFRTPLDTVVKGLDFDSNDHALIKKHLRAMVSTTVEWQSPTSGEGASWNVSGLLAHAKLSKERGQVWVEWSYAVNLKQELLEPTVFARLRLEVISQLRTHAGVVLYEICTRYKDIGRTARQPWRWWYPVLSGNPTSEKTERLEYRIFKRDTLKPAIAEVNSITDLDIELVEHKQGRFVDEIQFYIGLKKQTNLALTRPPRPVDVGLVTRAAKLGIPEETLEPLWVAHGEAAVHQALEALERRMANPFPEALRDPLRYLKALLANAAPPASAATATSTIDGGLPTAARELPSARKARWQAEWTRREHDRCAAAINALSEEAQRELETQLLESLRARDAHPSIIKRLGASGWQHPMVRQEMLKFFGDASFGAGWDKPTAEQLLEIASQIGVDQEAGDPADPGYRRS
ncbi:replication initiation protein [Variovorax paradoxus]|uniref:replication initiation protein n=1 Tax=Variovorax paradoxus TaxID=34073 RepID=UPI0019344E5F|nr:replication initiation protein [Variovorax paradoxus]